MVDKKSYRKANNKRFPQLEEHVNRLGNWLYVTLIVFAAGVTVAFTGKYTDGPWWFAGIVTTIMAFVLLAKAYSIYVFNLMDDVKQVYKAGAPEAYLISFWIIPILDKMLVTYS